MCGTVPLFILIFCGLINQRARFESTSVSSNTPARYFMRFSLSKIRMYRPPPVVTVDEKRCGGEGAGYFCYIPPYLRVRSPVTTTGVDVYYALKSDETPRHRGDGGPNEKGELLLAAPSAPFCFLLLHYYTIRGTGRAHTQ